MSNEDIIKKSNLPFCTFILLGRILSVSYWRDHGERKGTAMVHACFHRHRMRVKIKTLILKIFSHSVGCRFVLLTVSFALQKLFSFRRSHLLVVSPSVYAGGVLFSKWSPVPMRSRSTWTFVELKYLCIVLSRAVTFDSWFNKIALLSPYWNWKDSRMESKGIC